MKIKIYCVTLVICGIFIFNCAVVTALPPTGYLIVQQHTLKSPTGFRSINAQDFRGASVVGYGQGLATSDNTHALLWPTPTSTPIDIHPAGYQTSVADYLHGDQIAGVVRTAEDQSRAFLWDGPTHTPIDLHPEGYRFSVTYNVNNGWQYGAAWMNLSHAFKWQGTAASGIDMHPAGYGGSWVTFGDGVQAIGTVSTLTNRDHAALWTDDESVIDLNPPGYPRSYGAYFSGGQQVGQAYFESGGAYHAFLWSGTAESGIDLNPAGWRTSSAAATNGLLQVGYGRVNATRGDTHALLWNGTADSFIDLGALLPVGTSSFALRIDGRGHVFGHAFSDNLEYAIEWAPIPEPSTSVFAGLVTIVVLTSRKRHSSKSYGRHAK
jgi:hypothetical protein